jgi:hypothetical protein
MINGKRILALILTFLLTNASLLILLIPLESFCSQDGGFTIINVISRSSSGSLKIYPGSRRVSLKIEAAYLGNEAARSVTGCLKTFSGIEFSAGSGSCAPARSLNGSVALSVNKGDHVTFDYYLDISSSLSAGTYILGLNITYHVDLNLLYEAYNISITVSPYPEIQIRVIDAYLSPAASPGSVNTNLYVLMENNGESTIDSADLEVTLPNGFTVNNPRVRVNAVSVNARFTAVFSGISVPISASRGTYIARINVDASLRTEDNVNYNDAASIEAQFSVTDPPREEPLMISSVAILYQGSPAPLLPSASGVTLRTVMINRLPDAVSGMVITPTFPSGITLKSISGTYVNGMAPGGSCFIDMTIDVNPSLQPGRYSVLLHMLYVRIVSGASYTAEQDAVIQVFIESPHIYIPEISLSSAYWGSPNPSPAYEESRYVPLTLEFINNGRYNIVGGIIRASSQFLKPIKDSEALASRLAPGSYGSVTLYFDINANVDKVAINISASYIFDEFGAHLNITRSFEASLLVEKYPALASSMEIVSSGWQNSYNVFPNTDNATYQVTIANRAPYSASGIILLLHLPEKMLSSGRGEASAYIEGPIRSLGTFTASFSISVGNVQPGKYNATLTVDFILLSGGPGVRRLEKFNLTIPINDDSQALEFVSSRWYEGAVGPNTYGAHLLITFRNNYVDSMRGAILELNLPSGFLNSADNSSSVRTVPASMQVLQAIQPIQMQDLSGILGQYISASQTSPAQTFARGDILTFLIGIHVLNVEIGTHHAEGMLSYIDQWGTRRDVLVEVPITVLGRVEYVGVFMNGSIAVRRRFTNASLTIVNFGSSPIYDVYVLVSPYQGAPILIASPAVNYIKVIGAGERIETPVTLAYNPLGSISQAGGTAVINYGTVPFMVSLIYRDASGAVRSFNNTVTVILEPFIDLIIKDVRATGKNSSSSVSGTIVNYGSATAYRVEASLQVGNISRSTLVGDVDPGSEIVFRVDVPKYASEGTLTIKYYNIFNELEHREMKVGIEMQIEPGPVTTPKEGGISLEMWIIIVAVIAFLAIVTLLIYRFLKSRSINRV